MTQHAARPGKTLRRCARPSHRPTRWGLTVFNIKGNHYRLIVRLRYDIQIIFIKRLLTHAEYDWGDWKNDSTRTSSYDRAIVNRSTRAPRDRIDLCIQQAHVARAI